MSAAKEALSSAKGTPDPDSVDSLSLSCIYRGSGLIIYAYSTHIHTFAIGVHLGLLQHDRNGYMSTAYYRASNNYQTTTEVL